MAKLTLKQLERAGACPEGRLTFERMFGHKVRVTVEACIQHAEVFGWNWAAKHLLTPENYREWLRRVCREDGISIYVHDAAREFARLYIEQEG